MFSKLFPLPRDKYYAVKFVVNLRSDQPMGIVVSTAWNHTFMVVKVVQPGSKSAQLGIKPYDRICMVDNLCHPQLDAKKMKHIFATKTNFLMIILRKKGTYKGYKQPEPMEEEVEGKAISLASGTNNNTVAMSETLVESDGWIDHSLSSDFDVTSPRQSDSYRHLSCDDFSSFQQQINQRRHNEDQRWFIANQFNNSATRRVSHSSHSVYRKLVWSHSNQEDNNLMQQQQLEEEIMLQNKRIFVNHWLEHHSMSPEALMKESFQTHLKNYQTSNYMPVISTFEHRDYLAIQSNRAFGTRAEENMICSDSLTL